MTHLWGISKAAAETKVVAAAAAAAAAPPKQKQKQEASSSSSGNKEENAVPSMAECRLGKRCRADSFLARLESLQEQGDAAAIVQGMRKHSKHAQVQQQGCRSLSRLARDDDNRIKIAEAGGIEAILAALVAHTDAGGWGGGKDASALVVGKAFAALCKLAVSDGNKTKISAARGNRGIKVIVDAMTAHKESVRVQQHACGVLYRLADNEENQVQIAGAGGITAVLATMKRHKSSADLQQYACGTLHNLARQASLRQRIEKLGGVERVEDAVSASNATRDTREWGKSLLDSLDGHNDYCEISGEKGGESEKKKQKRDSDGSKEHKVHDLDKARAIG
jgi:hypothetical protein